MRGLRPLVALVALVALLGLTGTAPARPNIVLVLTDDQRWDTVSAMPNVTNRLVRPGVDFRNAFASNPLCCPSRVSILTGRYSHSTGVFSNRPPHGGFASFRDRVTIATRLRAAGYRTAYMGKYLNGYANNTYVPPGWDRWLAFANAGYYDYRLNVDGRLETGPTLRSLYSTDRLAAEAVRFVRESRRPFFLVLAPYAPHEPAEPARRHARAFSALVPWRSPSYRERNVSDKPAWVRAQPRTLRFGPQAFRRRQLQSRLAGDQVVGRLVRALRGQRLLRNTVVVFTSDNGYLWGEHRLSAKAKPYEESIRVPLVVRYDALTRGRPRSVERLVANVDLAPTFAAAARTRLPGAEGRSLLPFLAGRTPRWRSALLLETLPVRNQAVPAWCAVRTRERILVAYATGDRELYDLTRDPYELRSLHDDPAWNGTERALRARLGRLCNPPPPGLRRSLLCTHEGGAGPDELVGSRGYDILCSRAGPDSVTPGPGPDWVYAGDGRDTVRARDRRRDHVSCGAGRDVARVDALDVVDANCEIVRRA